MATKKTRRVARVSAIVVAVAAVGGGTASAYASHISSPVSLGGTLTSSIGATSISVSGGTAIRPQICDESGNCTAAQATYASWSADGSRVAFVNQNEQIETAVRTAAGYEWWSTMPTTAVQRDSPTFDSTGEYLIWSERADPASPAKLVFANAAASMIDYSYTWLSDAGYDYTNPDAGPNGKVVYQRNTDSAGKAGGTPEVWLGDFNTGSTQLLFSNASQPAVTTDKVAFVRSDGTTDQIFVAPLTADGVGDATQLTTGGTNKQSPTFSPDGSQVAYTSASGAINVIPAAGGTATEAPGVAGIAAYQTKAQDTVYRISGANRYSTSAAVSRAHWKDGAADAVVLSRSDDFADALGGSALAAAKHGPLLLTPPGSLNATSAAEISRVLGKSNAGATVYLLGGTGAISTATENAVKALGYQTVRLAGADRYATSLAIAKEISPTPGLILAATGKDFPDALAAGAAAGDWTSSGTPGVVVLTNNAGLPAATKAYLDANDNPDTTLIAAIGGQAVTALKGYPDAISISGSTRYQTASYVAQAFFGGTRYAGIATGRDWPDALAGGALLGTVGGPLLLVNGTASTLDANAAWVLSDRSAAIANPLVFGGTGAVNAAQVNAVGGWVSTTFTTASNPTALPTDPSLGGSASSSSTKALAKAKAKIARKAGKLTFLSPR